jgi:hypothetical protein
VVFSADENSEMASASPRSSGVVTMVPAGRSWSVRAPIVTGVDVGNEISKLSNPWSMVNGPSTRHYSWIEL